MRNQVEKEEKIEVKNDTGRLSKEEVEAMLKDAEKYSEEDQKLKEQIDSKNSLENIVYQMKSMLDDKNVSDKLDASLKDELTKEVSDLITWLNDNQNEEKSVYESKKIEFQNKMKPILSKNIPDGMMPDMSNFANDTTPSDETKESTGPNIEEVD